jgi:hypothetical protein
MALHTIEALGIRVATLTGALIAGEKLNIESLILGSSQGNDITEAVKFVAYLTACELAGDVAVEKILGFRSVSLHRDLPVNLLTTFGSNVGVYYILEKTNIVDMIEKKFGRSSDLNKAAAIAVVYALITEITYQILKMWVLRGEKPEKYKFP